VPYPPVDHGDGRQNYGYVRIKDNPGNLRLIPEAADWPEMTAFLVAVNAAGSPIESVGCEKAFSPAELQRGPTVKLTSYTDVVFTDAALNDAPENALLLSSHLLQAVQGCECWWSEIEIVLERFRGVIGASAPWGLMLRVTGYGRDEDEARKWWGESIGRIAKAVTKLPRDLSWRKPWIWGSRSL